MVFRYLIMFVFIATSTTEIYTLSLHDALPISAAGVPRGLGRHHPGAGGGRGRANRSRGPAAPAGGERSAHGNLQLPTTRARARHGKAAVVPHRSSSCGGADGSGRPQEGERSLWPRGRQLGPAA